MKNRAWYVIFTLLASRQMSPEHTLISAAYQLTYITARRPSLSWLTASIPKNVRGDIVMPMCRSPQISDALLRTSKLPANDNLARTKQYQVFPRINKNCQGRLADCSYPLRHRTAGA